MFDWLSDLVAFETLGLLDVLDVLLVALLVFGTMSLLRRTRGAPVAIGIILFLLIWRFAVALELQALGTILEIAGSALPFVIVLLFQNTIRRALTTLGRNPLFRLVSPPEDEQVVENIALAALSLASQGLGAIIVVERELGLRTYIDSGIAIDGKVSYEVLMALFHRRSPLHDGAVVISHGRIAAASCLLPLTAKPHLAGRHGSRHRAAIGLSEETDAVVIVVSEERGQISVVRDGEMQVVQATEMRDLLARELATPLRHRRALPAPA